MVSIEDFMAKWGITVWDGQIEIRLDVAVPLDELALYEGYDFVREEYKRAVSAGVIAFEKQLAELRQQVGSL